MNSVPSQVQGPETQLEEAKLLSVPIEFTPFLLLILWSVYFTGTGELQECELKANVFLYRVSSFAFFFFYSPFPPVLDGMSGLSLHRSAFYC